MINGKDLNFNIKDMLENNVNMNIINMYIINTTNN